MFIFINNFTFFTKAKTIRNTPYQVFLSTKIRRFFLALIMIFKAENLY